MSENDLERLEFSLERAPSHVNKLSEELKGWAAMSPTLGWGWREAADLFHGTGEFDAAILGTVPLAAFGAYKVAEYSSNDEPNQIIDVDEEAVANLLEGSEDVKVGATGRKLMQLPIGSDVRQYESSAVYSGEGANEIYQDICKRRETFNEKTQSLGHFTVPELENGYELWVEEYNMDGNLLDATGFRGAENPAEILGYTPDSDVEAILSQ